MVNPEQYSQTNVFKNRLGIRDAAELALQEAKYTALRSLELSQNPAIVGQTFDADHLSAIHHHLFADLFDWAGQWRSYNFAKGNSIFTPAEQLAAQSNGVFTQLARSLAAVPPATQPDNATLITLLSRYYCLLNKLHPFPEGNGRTQRLFISHLAYHFNAVLDWASVHPWEIVETAIAAHERNDYKPTESMLSRILLT